MILRQIHDLIPRNESDETGIQLLAEFRQKFLFPRHIAAVSDDTGKAHFSPRCKAADALGDIIRRIERHQLTGGNDIDLLRVSFTDRHGKPSAYDIPEDIVERYIHIRDRLHFIQKLQCDDDTASRAAHPRLRPACFDTGDAMKSGMYDVFPADLIGILSPHLVQHRLFTNMS